MRPQTLYRGGEDKKAKPTKADKVWNAVQKANRRAESRKAGSNTRY